MCTTSYHIFFFFFLFFLSWHCLSFELRILITPMAMVSSRFSLATIHCLSVESSVNLIFRFENICLLFCLFFVVALFVCFVCLFVCFSFCFLLFCCCLFSFVLLFACFVFVCLFVFCCSFLCALFVCVYVFYFVSKSLCTAHISTNLHYRPININIYKR